MRQKKKFIESVMRNNKTGSNFGSKSQNFPKNKSDRDKTFKKRLIALIIILTVVPILTGFIMRYFLFSLMYLASITGKIIITDKLKSYPAALKETFVHDSIC